MAARNRKAKSKSPQQEGFELPDFDNLGIPAEKIDSLLSAAASPPPEHLDEEEDWETPHSSPTAAEKHESATGSRPVPAPRTAAPPPPRPPRPPLPPRATPAVAVNERPSIGSEEEFDVWDDDSDDDFGETSSDDDNGGDFDDDDGKPRGGSVVWRSHSRGSAKETARRQGGVFKAAVSPDAPSQRLSYSAVYSDDDDDDDWGFGDDEPASPPPRRPGAALASAPSASAPRSTGPQNHAGLNQASERSGERGVTMADVERSFEGGGCGDEGGGGDDGRDRARAFPAPTDADVVRLLALDPETQASLIASLFADRATADYQEALGLEEDTREARRRAEAEAAYGGTVDGYYHTSPERGGGGAAAVSPSGRAGGSARGTRLASLVDARGGRKQTLAQHFTDAVLEAGWLEKKGGGTSVLGNTRYKRRWFELVRTVKGLYLTYQTEPKDGLLKGAIKMSKARVQSDTRSRFSIHVESTTKGPRSYHIRAPTVEEKFAWLRAIDSVQPLPRQDATMFRGRSLPLLAGWLRTHVVRGRKALKPKHRWIQLWDKGENRGPFLCFLDAPGDTKAQLEVALRDALVVDDASEGSNAFSVMAVGGAEIRFSSPHVAKSKWLGPLAKRTSGGIVLEKNTGRHASVATRKGSAVSLTAPSPGGVGGGDDDADC